jgi:hypothetical protein
VSENETRALANRLATAAVLVLAFEKFGKRLPRLGYVDLNWVKETEAWDADLVPRVECSVANRVTRRRETVELEENERVDAVREWAHALGGELTLGNELNFHRASDAFRILSAEGELPNGLRVRVQTSIDYPVSAPSAETASAA